MEMKDMYDNIINMDDVKVTVDKILVD